MPSNPTATSLPAQHEGRQITTDRPAFTMIPNWFIDSYMSQLTPTETLVYLTLMRHANLEKKSWPSVQRLMFLLSSSERTIQRAISVLVEKGLVQRETRFAKDGSQLSNRYFLPWNGPLPATPVSGGRGDTVAGEGGVGDAPNINVDTEEQDTSLRAGDGNVVTLPPKYAAMDAEMDRPAIDNGFDLFWAGYPKKDAKPEAQKAWKQIGGGVDTAELIRKDISRRFASKDWELTKDRRRFIPNPATYLRARRWEDEPVEEVASERYDGGEWDTGKLTQMTPEQLSRHFGAY